MLASDILIPGSRELAIARIKEVLESLAKINPVLKSQRIKLRKNDNLCVISKTMVASRPKSFFNLMGWLGDYRQTLIFSEGPCEKYKITEANGIEISANGVDVAGYGKLELTKDIAPDDLITYTFTFSPERGTKSQITVDFYVKVNRMVETQNRLTLLNELIRKAHHLTDVFNEFKSQVSAQSFSSESVTDVATRYNQYQNLCRQIIDLKALDEFGFNPNSLTDDQIEANVTPTKAIGMLETVNKVILMKFLNIILGDDFELMNDLTASQINRLLKLVHTDPLKYGVYGILEKLKGVSEKEFKDKFTEHDVFYDFLINLELLFNKVQDSGLKTAIKDIILKAITCINNKKVLDSEERHWGRIWVNFKSIFKIYSKFIPADFFSKDIDLAVKYILFNAPCLDTCLPLLLSEPNVKQYIRHNLIAVINSKDHGYFDVYHRAQFAIKLPDYLYKDPELSKAIMSKTKYDDSVYKQPSMLYIE